MTRNEAIAAMETQTRVEAGKPGTDAHDLGVIHDVNEHGDAMVGWESGASTMIDTAELRIAE